MKIFIIIFLIFPFISLAAKSSSLLDDDKNAVFLDLNEQKEEKSQGTSEVKEGIINMEVLNNNYPDYRQKEHDTLLYKDVNRLQPEKKSISKSFEKKILKDTTLGATYSATEKSGNPDDSVSVYSKYKKGKFAFTTAYSQNRNGYKENGITGGNVSFSPEVSLNNHLKLKNVYSENTATNQQKNEMVLSISPFKDDRMDLDLGAGQTFSTTNEPAKSQINFGTKFRF